MSRVNNAVKLNLPYFHAHCAGIYLPGPRCPHLWDEGLEGDVLRSLWTSWIWQVKHGCPGPWQKEDNFLWDMGFDSENRKIFTTMQTWFVSFWEKLCFPHSKQALRGKTRALQPIVYWVIAHTHPENKKKRLPVMESAQLSPVWLLPSPGF